MKKEDIHLKFFGQGFLGKNLADSFFDRGYKNILRYSLEKEYRKNESKLGAEPGIAFICVPTPNRQGIFDGSAVDECLGRCRKDDIAVVRSTVTPRFFETLTGVPDIVVYMPEFLDESTARHDIDNPSRTVVGVADIQDDRYLEAARKLFEIMPKAPYEVVCAREDAALIKLCANAFFMLKNVAFNIFHDLAESVGCDYSTIRDAISADPRIGSTHTIIMDKGGRGAGGACLPKDFRTLREVIQDELGQFDAANSMLFHAERRNRKLLNDFGKDRKIVKEVYG